MSSIITNLASCSLEELEDMMKLLQPKLNEFIPHAPTPKQAAFMLLRGKEAFYGGAAGGGKSDALLMDALQNVDVKGYAAIIFRKTFADLTKPSALIPRAQEWLAPAIEDKKVKWDDKNKRFKFMERYGRHEDIKSILQFGYMETERDRFNYQGGEYQYIGWDEMTHIYEVCYKYMFSRLRRLKDVEIPLKMRGASNPPEDGEGEWVYTRFVDPATRRKNAIFIPADMNDNPYLDTEEYSLALDELDPVTRARLKDGNWNIRAQGNMFRREWFPVVGRDQLPENRVSVRFWDMAATTKKKSDNTVGFKMSRFNDNYYIEDIEVMKAAPSDVEERAKALAQADGYSTHIREEQEPGSSGIFSIANHSTGIFSGFDYAGIPSLNNKVERAKPVSAYSNKGYVYIVDGCRNVDLLFKQAEVFPSKNMHDDLVDGLSGSYNYLSKFDFYGEPISVSDGTGSNYVDRYYDD